MSVNKVLLLGRLGVDPELKYTQNQVPVCNFSLATNDRRKVGEEWTDHTEWHRIVTFGRQAENCSQYLKKGRQAFIDGKVQTRKWQDKEGKDRYTTEIVANNIQFISSKDESGGEQYSGSQQKVANSGDSFNSGEQKASGIESVPFDDDDIPF